MEYVPSFSRLQTRVYVLYEYLQVHNYNIMTRYTNLLITLKSLLGNRL